MSDVNVTLDVSAVPVQPAGAGRYIIELVQALSRHDECSIRLITRKGDGPRWSTLDRTASIVSVVPDPRPLRLIYEKVRLGAKVSSFGPTIYHGPHYTLPGRCAMPTVVTIHDMTFFDQPDVHEKAKVHFFQAAIKQAARRADALVCVSSRTAAAFRARFPDSGPVITAPHGIDHLRFSPTPPAPTTDEVVLTRLGLDVNRPRFVHVGTLEPRKGLVDLLKAFEKVVAAVPEIELVFVGQRGWGLEGFDQALKVFPSPDSVRFTGYVADEDLPSLLRTASAVVYPSINEGFGLPAAEGLACGAAVVTTRGSVMEEICGPAAWLAEPANPDSLARVLLEAFHAEATERERRKISGLERVQDYTWDKAAASHLEAYRVAAVAHGEKQGK